MKRVYLVCALIALSSLMFATNLISENIQTWTSHGSYGSYTQAIAAGTVNMTRCIVAPTGTANGTGTTGYVQMEASNGIIELPALSSAGTAEFHIHAGGAGRTAKLEKYNGSSWVLLTTFSGIGVTGATFTYTVNSSSSTTLRLSTPSAAIYVHDIIVSDYSAGTPTILVSGTLSAFSTTTGTASAYQSYKVSGTNLTADIVVTAPTSFELCKTSGGTYTASLTFAQSGGSIAVQDVFVRIAASASPGTPSGNITHTSTDATQVDKAISGIVNKTAPSNHVTGFTADLGTPSYSAVTISWTDAAKVTPDGYLIKGSNVGYSSIPNPVDGTEEANGTLVRNVTQGTQTYTFTGLDGLTSYYFKIFPYTNSGTNILYKTDGTVPQDDATTTATPPQYLVNFEGTLETKASYTSGTINLTGLDWNMTDVMTSTTTDADWYLNGRSARLRGYGTSAMTMLVNKTTGAGNVSFKYRRYGTDAQVDWKVEYSTDDGVNWTQLGSIFTAPASDDVQTFSENLNIAGNVRIRIKRATESGTTNKRLNIDDIAIIDYPAYDYPEGQPKLVSGVTIELITGNANNSATAPGSVPNTHFVPSFQQVFNLIGAGPWDISLSAEASTMPWFAVRRGTTWTSYANTTGTVSFTVPAGTKDAELEIQGGSGQDPTLPVELSSFTALVNGQNMVSIQWVTQSETNINGYYVNRSVTPNLDEAIQVSSLIQAQNSSTQQVYQFIDEELVDPGTYYYWLQVQEMDGSIEFHGPISVIYNAGGDPGNHNETPIATEITGIYPNPFNPSATVRYALTKDTQVNMVIYNARGQIIRSINEGFKTVGTHPLIWDGKDNSGRNCSTGVYFFKMQAGNVTSIKKAVLMK